MVQKQYPILAIDSEEFKKLLAILYQSHRLNMGNVFQWLSNAKQLDIPELKNVCLATINDLIKIADFKEEKIITAVQIFKLADIIEDETIKENCIAYFKEAFSQSFKKVNFEYYIIFPEYPESIDLFFEQATQRYNERLIHKEERKQIIHQLTHLLGHLQDNLENGKEKYREIYFKLVGKLFELKEQEDYLFSDWWQIIEKSPLEKLTKLILEYEDSWHLLRNLLVELNGPNLETVQKAIHHFIIETLPTHPNGEQIYLNFVRYIFEQIKKEDRDLGLIYWKIIGDLPQEKLRELATLISIHEDAWDLLRPLLMRLHGDRAQDILETSKKALKNILPTIQDGNKLLVLCDSVRELVIGQLTFAQIEMIVRIWIAKLDFEDLHDKIFDFMSDVLIWPEQDFLYILKKFSVFNIQIIQDL